MFKFFTKRWVSRKEFDEKESELKSAKQKNQELFDRYFKKEGELLDIVEAKEKEMQKKIQEISAFRETLIRTRLMLEDKEKEAKQLKKKVELWQKKARIETERSEILAEQYWVLKEKENEI
jgi:hypothetical protein